VPHNTCGLRSAYQRKMQVWYLLLQQSMPEVSSFSDIYWISVSGIKLRVLIQWHPRNQAMPSEWVSSSFSQFK
jgi:hypothetical protein